MNQEKYFDWLCSWVCDHKRSKRKYYYLLKLLFETDFIYLKQFDMNRAIDGEDLRYRFRDETGLEVFDPGFKTQCRVLEMLVALSIRIQNDYMDNPIDGDQTSRWFWDMIFNLELLEFDNAHYDYDTAYYRLMRFLTCKYDYDGRGGLFTIQDPDMPVYDMEIWTQADIWVDQNF